jgi:hypothetical protein
MDGMSLCIAEAARRLLRTENTTLIVPESFFEAAQQLSLEISDGIPKLIREPTVTIGGNSSVEISGLAYFGSVEPDVTICWVPTSQLSIEKVWQKWVAQIHDLMSAGYPGCVGCGGPGSEGVWDELASRARTRVT